MSRTVRICTRRVKKNPKIVTKNLPQQSCEGVWEHGWGGGGMTNWARVDFLLTLFLLWQLGKGKQVNSGNNDEAKVSQWFEHCLGTAEWEINMGVGMKEWGTTRNSVAWGEEAEGTIHNRKTALGMDRQLGRRHVWNWLSCKWQCQWIPLTQDSEIVLSATYNSPPFSFLRWHHHGTTIPLTPDSEIVLSATYKSPPFSFFWWHHHVTKL